jgi:hypothetical protein
MDDDKNIYEVFIMKLKLNDRKITIPKGNYTIYRNQVLNIPSNIKIEFEPGTIIKVLKNDVIDRKIKSHRIFYINPTNSDIENIEIVGNGLKVVGIMDSLNNYGIDINNNFNKYKVRNITISNIEFSNFSSAGIGISGNQLKREDNAFWCLITKVEKKQNIYEVTSDNDPAILESYVETEKLIRINECFFRVIKIKNKVISIIPFNAHTVCKPIQIDKGDEILISGIPENIVFNKVKCNKNGDNGATITQGNNIKFSNSEFNRNNGPNPGCGFDVEPNKLNQVFDVSFENCDFSNNNYNGLFIHKADGLASYCSSAKNCTFKENRLNGLVITQQYENEVTLEDIIAEKNNVSGVHVEGIGFRCKNILTISNMKFGLRILANETNIVDSYFQNNEHNLISEVLNNKNGSITVVNTIFINNNNPNPNAIFHDKLYLQIKKSTFIHDLGTNIELNDINSKSLISNSTFKSNDPSNNYKVSAFKINNPKLKIKLSNNTINCEMGNIKKENLTE